ncbi:hypothetical protein [Microbulbifer aggregans]|nr:hypothetical protein [Microbulbifer aggregans]
MRVSAVTFTTLRDGSVVQEENRQLLASFQAVSAVIMFGCTTAVVMTVGQGGYVWSGSGEQ